MLLELLKKTWREIWPEDAEEEEEEILSSSIHTGDRIDRSLASPQH